MEADCQSNIELGFGAFISVVFAQQSIYTPSVTLEPIREAADQSGPSDAPLQVSDCSTVSNLLSSLNQQKAVFYLKK